MHTQTIPTAEELIREYGPMVSALCRRMMRDEDAARDAAQETWIAVLKALPGFRGDAALSTWIYAIARRVVIAYARRERTYSLRHLSAYFDGPERELPDDLRLEDEVIRKQWTEELCGRCLSGVLLCLDPDARMMFLLRDLSILEYRDIARVMELNEPAVRKAVSRSRRKVRNFLEGHCSLVNSDGSCRCRQARHVQQYNLREEYERLRGFARHATLLQRMNEAFPGKDYWQKFLSDFSA